MSEKNQGDFVTHTVHTSRAGGDNKQITQWVKTKHKFIGNYKQFACENVYCICELYTVPPYNIIVFPST